MSTDNRKLATMCGIFGIVAVACYFIGAVLELPVPDGIGLLIFFGFPGFGIAQWYLLRKVISADDSSTLGDLALIFATAGFTLLTAMVMSQMAARLGIAELQSQAASEAQRSELKLILKGVRFVDFGLDVAWDFFIGTAFILTGIGVRRVPGIGLVWGLPLSVLGLLLIGLNAWTFPWPPNTRGLFDVGPFCASYLVVFSVRLLLLGRRMRPTVAG
jgi:hypothetical protein